VLREAIFTAGDPKGSALFLIYTHQTHGDSLSGIADEMHGEKSG
jgi:hypothetical protein